MTTFEGPRNAGGDYGARIRGYLHPTVTGPYRFWIASDDTSALFTLEAGKRYYIEVLHKESDQKDNLSVAWLAPGGVREVIDGAFLSPFE